MDVPSSSENTSSFRSPFLIGVAGGTASGKTTVCSKIMERLGCEHQRQVTSISCESFYRDLTESETEKANQGKFNFDHPDSFDFKLMHEMINTLKGGKPVEIPKYDYINHCRQRSESIPISPVDVILVEGILVFYYKELRDLFNMKLFVDTDPDTRLARRVLRDVGERNRGLENILHQYVNLVKPAFEEFCLPSKKYADVIIPRGGDNDVAIDLIVQHIQDILSRSPRSTPLDDLSVAGDRYSQQVLNGRNRTLSEGSGMSNEGQLVRPH